MATVNYSFNLPTVGGDDDAWGDLLNANWSQLDGILDTLALKSVTLTAGDGLNGGGNLGANRTFAVDGTVLRADGSVAMAGNLPLGDNRITGLAAGTDPADATTKAQLDAATVRADVAEIRGLSGTNKLPTTENIATAAGLVTPSGAGDWTPNWTDFISANWVVTDDRTLDNPTNVIPGTTRVIRVAGNNATNRTISFGTNYVGDLNGGPVSDTTPILYTLFAATTSEIWVSAMEAG